MRDRGIRSKTWSSRAFSRLHPRVALTYFGLWNYADDYGRFDADPGLVWAALYTVRSLEAAHDPEVEQVTAIEVGGHLDALLEAGRLCSYIGCDGKTYMHIIGWEDEQDLRYQKASRIPPCRQHDGEAHCWRHRRGNPATCQSAKTEAGTADVVDVLDLQNRDGRGQPAESFETSADSKIRLDKTGQDKTATTTDVVVGSRTTRRAKALPDDFEITDEMVAWAAAKCPLADPDAETEQWRDHHRARGTTAKDWPASWRTWMRNAQKYATRDLRLRGSPMSTTDARVAQGEALVIKFAREGQ